jgi:hypothetical protein
VAGALPRPFPPVFFRFAWTSADLRKVLLGSRMATALWEVVVQGVWAYSVSCACAGEVACGHNGSHLRPEEGRGSGSGQRSEIGAGAIT